MPDLTQGYSPQGGNKAIVDAIAKRSQLHINWTEPELVKELFNNNFMPYAKSHWEYHGTNCNCEDLSSALWATWTHVRGMKSSRNPDLQYVGKKISISDDDGLITSARNVFKGRARGNVRQSTGLLDGRCLFAIHWVLKVGAMYFDPTFDRWTPNPGDIIQRRIRKRAPALWVAQDTSFLYLRNPDAAEGFSDSWNEMKAAGWLTAADWKTKTARSMHTRSKELVAVDDALGALEQRGLNAFDALKTAFTQWVARHPSEAAARNAGNCVTGLAGFLGVGVTLRG